MTITSTRHGLSVYTGADDATGADTTDNRRLRRPVPEMVIVNNTFNDATSGHYYEQRSGYEGIDFLCGTGTAVKAMYGGVVIKVVNNWTVGTKESLGNFVTIRSCTDPANGTGFEHTYASSAGKRQHCRRQRDVGGQGRYDRHLGCLGHIREGTDNRGSQ